MQKKKDAKVFLSLLFWTLIPSVYLVVRMHLIAVHNVDVNILGQMEWFDLIDEMITTALVVPLYCLLKGKDAKKNGFSFLLSFGVYFLFTVIISLYIGNIAAFMNAEYAKEYLFMQSISLLIAFAGTFANLLFVIYEQYRFIAALTVARLSLLVGFDCI